MDKRGGPTHEARIPDSETRSSAIQPSPPSPCDQITDLVVNSVHSEHSRRAYRRAIEDFVAWYQAFPGRAPLSKVLVQHYRVALTEANLAPSTINGFFLTFVACPTAQTSPIFLII